MTTFKRAVVGALAAATMLSGLGACAALHLGGPTNIITRTVADEQVVVGIELAYKGARIAVEFAVDSGAIKTPEQKAVWKTRNQAAYAAMQKVEATYTAANAESATDAITALLALTGKDN